MKTETRTKSIDFLKEGLFFLPIFLILFFSYFFSSQDLRADTNTRKSFLKAEVDKAIVSPGETLTFRLRGFSSLKEGPLYLPESGDKIQGFRIIDFGKEGPSKEDGEWVFERWYKLEADLTGSYILPSLKVSFKSKTGKETSLSSPEIFVEVKNEVSKTSKGVNKKEGGEGSKGKESGLRDIKPLKFSPSLVLTYVIGALLVLSALGFLIYYLIKRKRNQGDFLPTTPPHERALLELENLKKGVSSLSDYSKRKIFYFSLSDIVRSYVEDSYQFPAKERTQEEIRRDIDLLKSIEPPQQRAFLGILKEADLVKFANIAKSEKEGEGLLEDAKNFVLETMPKEIEKENEEDSVL